jgi:diguanylate cyclase (GGDEF)-like protein
MEAPAIPADEKKRLDTLRGLGILDTAAEERFDRVTRLAQRLLGVPIALVSLVDADRQWFKSRVGLEATETPRDVSFCGHAILRDEPFVIEDATADPRFADNPLVVEDPEIRFYAGCPITVAGTSRVGTLCVIDRQPRSMSPEDLELLRDLTAMVEQELSALRLATTDELTGLCNRRGLQALGSHVLAVADRTGRPVGILYADVDNLKPINDELGHDMGDRAIRAAASVIHATLRRSDVVARIGGDEFCALLTGVEATALPLPAERLEAALARRNATGSEPFELSISAGWFDYDLATPCDIDTLIARADEAMYRVKQRRRAAGS